MNKLFFSLIAMMLPLIASADDSGTCGNNLTWTYVEATKTLTISGTGVMSNYNPRTSSLGRKAPWHDLNVEKLILENGITEIGQNAFDSYNIIAVNIPASVTKIGKDAFEGCKLENIVANNSSTDIFYYVNGQECYAFSDKTFMHAMLYIPENTWSDYVYMGDWWRFYNIREISTNISMLSSSQVYTLMNTSDFGYAIYDNVSENITKAKAFYSIDENNLNSCWQIVEMAGMKCLYNVGAKKYANFLPDGNISLSNSPVNINMKQSEMGIILGQNSQQWAFVKNSKLSNATNIELKNSDTKNAKYFSLDGRQISSPQKGIIIINGKKVFVK